MWQGIKNFAKNHPFLTAFIIAGLITAGVFTGGLIFAPMAVFYGFAVAGAVVGATAAGLGTMGLIEGATRTPFNPESERGGTSDAGGLIFGLGAAVAVGVGLAAGWACLPLGVALCGATLVAGIGSLCGWIAQAFSSKPSASSNATGSDASPPSPPSSGIPAGTPSVSPGVIPAPGSSNARNALAKAAPRVRSKSFSEDPRNNAKAVSAAIPAATAVNSSASNVSAAPVSKSIASFANASRLRTQSVTVTNHRDPSAAQPPTARRRS